MATAGDGSAVMRPLFVMVGLVERQAMVELTNTREREIHPIVFGFKFGLCLGCKESARKSREIFLVHTLQLFYFIF